MADQKNTAKPKEAAKTRATKAAAAKAAATARANTLKQAAITNPAGRHLGGFMGFVREQGVVGLAVGLVLGTQVKTVVDQLIASFINPLLGLLLPGKGNLVDKTFSISLGDKTSNFGYGAFMSVLLSFIIVAAIIYFVVKGLKLDKLDKKKET